MKNKTRALVVLSGGQDSTTCLFLAKTQYDYVEAITFDYGQRHAIEIEAAIKVAQLAGVKHEIVKVPNCLISTSPLLSDNELEQYESPEQMAEVIGNRRELTFVPMRNALFLTIAANRAEASHFNVIVTGVCQEDNANYSDCRASFIAATTEYINYALGHDTDTVNAIRIDTPLMRFSKAETCKLAAAIPGCLEALAYSHTSYDGKYPPTDNNHANVLRADGFAKAGMPDPLVLRAVSEGLMEMPTTPNYSQESLNENA